MRGYNTREIKIARVQRQREREKERKREGQKEKKREGEKGREREICEMLLSTHTRACPTKEV